MGNVPRFKFRFLTYEVENKTAELFDFSLWNIYLTWKIKFTKIEPDKEVIFMTTETVILPADKGAIQTTGTNWGNSTGVNFAEVSAYASKELLTHEAITRNSVLAKDSQLESVRQASDLRFDLSARTDSVASALAARMDNIHAAVVAGNQATRDLMHSFNASQSAVALQDAKDTISALKAKLGIVP